MRPLSEQDFDKMATRVVDQFMGGRKLAEVAADEAAQAQLTPDQIERLVQAANTMAFLRLMEEQKAHAREGGPDMTREFDPIDAGAVIKSLLGAAAPGEGMMEATPGVGLDELSLDADNDDECEDDYEDSSEDDDNDGPFPKGDKQKQAEHGRNKRAAVAAAVPDRLKVAAFADRRNRKLLGILEDQYRQAEWAFEDEFSKLATVLKRASNTPSLAAFEKDAMALHPDAAGTTVLNLVRGSRGMPALSLEYVQDKYASLADRHIVDDNEAVRLFDKLVKIANQASKLQTGVTYLREKCF